MILTPTVLKKLNEVPLEVSLWNGNFNRCIVERTINRRHYRIVCAVHLLWFLSAYSFVYLKKPVAAWQYVNAARVASAWALPVAYKHSFGG